MHLEEKMSNKIKGEREGGRRMRDREIEREEKQKRKSEVITIITW